MRKYIKLLKIALFPEIRYFMSNFNNMRLHNIKPSWIDMIYTNKISITNNYYKIQ